VACGNGVCEAAQGEDCEACVADCGCPAGQSCTQKQCVAIDTCGDGACDAAKSENCATCPVDCACPLGQSCDSLSNTCKDPQPPTETVPEGVVEVPTEAINEASTEAINEASTETTGETAAEQTSDGGEQAVEKGTAIDAPEKIGEVATGGGCGCEGASQDASMMLLWMLALLLVALRVRRTA
jgi:MYXO-CTERM domain-containing protein